MDVPPESGLDVAPFLAVTAWLRAGGFSAPEVLGADRATRPRPARGPRRRPLRPPLRRASPPASPPLYARRRRPPRRPPAPPAPGADVGWTPPPYDLAFLMREVAAGARMVPPRRHRRRAVAPDLAAEYDALAEAALAAVADARAVAGAPRLPRREPALAARPPRPRARRPARLPGHAARPPGLRPHLAARGRPPRRRPRRSAPRCSRATSPAAAPTASAFRAAAAPARGPAQPQDPRPLHPALPPRRQAALPRLPAAGLGAPRARPRPPALAPLAAFVARHVPAPDAAVLARIEAAMAPAT